MSTVLAELASRLKAVEPAAVCAPKDAARTGFVSEICVPVSGLRATLKAASALGYFLECLSGADFTDCAELSYILNRHQEPERVIVKCAVPKAGEPAPSVMDIFAAADWYEREIFDLFGVTFAGRGAMQRLLLPESSAIHPLLKSFKGEAAGTDLAQTLRLIAEDRRGFENEFAGSVAGREDHYELNFGPQHPSTHGVLRIVAILAGERLCTVTPTIGYGHRGHEKMAELQDYRALWPNFGRIDYVGAMAYNLAYAEIIERAAGIAVPPRAQALRVLLVELNRLASHLLWLSSYLLDLGAFTPYFYCFDDREKILDITEHCTGERLTYSCFRFGGLLRDVPEDAIVPLIRAFIPHFRQRLADYETLIAKNIIFRKRAEGIGRIAADRALAYGLTGPSLRGSGIAFDERRRVPHAIYPQLDFAVCVQPEGDAYARFRVRMDEMRESLNIIAQIYEKIPAGEVITKNNVKSVPKGEYYFSAESPRGSFGMHLYSDGSTQPYRLKLRTPSFSSASALSEMAAGCFVADLVSVLGSLDVIIPEIDR